MPLSTSVSRDESDLPGFLPVMCVIYVAEHLFVAHFESHLEPQLFFRYYAYFLVFMVAALLYVSYRLGWLKST